MREGSRDGVRMVKIKLYESRRGILVGGGGINEEKEQGNGREVRRGEGQPKLRIMKRP